MHVEHHKSLAQPAEGLEFVVHLPKDFAQVFLRELKEFSEGGVRVHCRNRVLLEGVCPGGRFYLSGKKLPSSSRNHFLPLRILSYQVILNKSLILENEIFTMDNSF